MSGPWVERIDADGYVRLHWPDDTQRTVEVSREVFETMIADLNQLVDLRVMGYGT